MRRHWFTLMSPGSFKGKFVFTALLFNFFPWLSFSLNSFDMQPWTIFFNTVVVLLFLGAKVHWVVWGLYSFLGVVLALAVVGFDYYSLRALASYYLLIVGFHFFYIVFKFHPNIFLRALCVSNILWVFFGLFQLLFGVEALADFVNLRYSDDRGVTSLSPEPTHFGFHLVFLSWLYLILSYHGFVDKRKGLIFVFINFLSVVLLAKSSMALIYFLLMFFLFFLSVKPSLGRGVFFFTALFLMLSFSYLYLIFDSDSRISNVILGLFLDPFSVMRDDASVNARFSHLVLTFWGAIHSYFSLHGFSNFYGDSLTINEMLGGFFWYNYRSNIVMSGTGSLIYELGFVGLLFILLTLCYMLAFKLRNKFGFFSFLILWVLMSGAIPLSYPLLSAMATLVYFLGSKRITVGGNLDYA